MKDIDAAMRTKSGLMVGLGEEPDEIVNTMRDLRDAHCDLLTIGQYLRPSLRHLPVQRFYHPDEFVELKHQGQALALRTSRRGPLVRSSYHASNQEAAAQALRLTG